MGRVKSSGRMGQQSAERRASAPVPLFSLRTPFYKAVAIPQRGTAGPPATPGPTSDRCRSETPFTTRSVHSELVSSTLERARRSGLKSSSSRVPQAGAAGEQLHVPPPAAAEYGCGARNSFPPPRAPVRLASPERLRAFIVLPRLLSRHLHARRREPVPVSELLQPRRFPP